MQTANWRLSRTSLGLQHQTEIEIEIQSPELNNDHILGLSVRRQPLLDYSDHNLYVSHDKQSPLYLEFCSLRELLLVQTVVVGEFKRSRILRMKKVKCQNRLCDLPTRLLSWQHGELGKPMFSHSKPLSISNHGIHCSPCYLEET